MSEILSRVTIESTRSLLAEEAPRLSYVVGAGRRLLDHIDALEERHRDELERIKADRDALRDELDGIRPKTVTIPGPHHIWWDGKRWRNCQVPRPASLELFSRLDELTKAVELVQRGQDELRQRLDSRGKNH